MFGVVAMGIVTNGVNIVVQIRSGNIGFTAAKASELTLLAGPYEVSVDKASLGNLSVIGTGAVGASREKYGVNRSMT